VVFNGGTEHVEAKSDVCHSTKRVVQHETEMVWSHAQIMVPSCLNISEAVVFLVGSQQKVEVD
jgi:hypothetical protein